MVFWLDHLPSRIVEYIQMIKTENQDSKGNQRVNYQDKNLDYLEKIKEKKLREQEDRLLQEKREQQKRQNLRRKILGEASRNRDNKEKEEPEDSSSELMRTGERRKTNFESLPKFAPYKNRIQHSDSKEDQDQPRNHRDRYMSFLKNLTKTVKSKKEIEQHDKRRRDEQYAKIKQQLGFGNVQSKLGHIRRKANTDDLARSHSADKFESLIQKAEQQMPRTNKNFKKKNEEYLEKIKKKRQEERIAKQEQNLRKEKLKGKLKDFVMVTVKKNVLDGVYDEELEKKKGKKDKEKEDDQEDEEGSQESEETEKKSKRKLRNFPYVTDLTEWKKKNRIEATDKVFIVTGGYGELKKALKERGWYQNPDRNSPCFDFKYTLQGRELDFDKMQDFQMANHFQKAGCLTTKVGLTKSLRNIKWIKDISQDNFYPKCFDLNDEDDQLGFQTHFKICKALSILKIFDSFVRESSLSEEMKQKNKNLIEDLKLRTEVAINVCRKNIEDIDQIIDRKKTVKVVTEKEWEILAQDQLTEEGLAKKKHDQWLKSIDCKFNPAVKKQKPKGEKKNNKKSKEQGKENKETPNQQKDNEEQGQQQQVERLYEEVKELLGEYERRYPQFHITGHNNIWILKPAGLSRGRGITCYNNLVEIQDHIKCKQSQWIAQKYIENPLVILRRKFDIRQWVLVTDFNPLTIWFYEQCYIRFSAVDYDAKEVSNKFIHLTNNSIGSYHKKFGESHIKGNMFFQQDFADFLQDKEGSDIFNDRIKPQMKEIVKHSMMCGLQGVQNRKNTHELFGYDFMVDEDYKVWLIEINSSPSMDYSTHVTTRLVKECLRDIIKVVVDCPAVPKKDWKNVDTGKFKRIYKGVEIPEKPITTGLNLCLEGVPMKKPNKKNMVKVQNFSLDNK